MILSRIAISVIMLMPLLALSDCTRVPEGDLLIFTNASVWDGTGNPVRDNSAIVTRNGIVVNIVGMDDRGFSEEAGIIDLNHRYVVPGLINAHGHVGMARGLQTGPEIHSEENVMEQLNLYAKYGITTVVSLGDEPPQAFTVRNESGFASGQMARLFMSGPVLNPSTTEEARDDVASAMQNDPDWTKIRIDDALGERDKMQPDVYSAVIEASHRHNIPLAAHIVTLDDAKGILRSGGDLIAHSIRDAPVDQELIDLMLERDVCITPTLTREVSVFVYAGRPDFFDDPFFLAEADPVVLEQLQQPELQQRYTGRAADYYREALPLAKENMMALHHAGVRVAMGTDSGPPARFQGYFEHLEMKMMQEAGMTPEEVLISATRNAAGCMNIGEELGTLESGKRADFVVLEENPLDDIQNLRSIGAVYIGAVEVER